MDFPFFVSQDELKENWTYCNRIPWEVKSQCSRCRSGFSRDRRPGSRLKLLLLGGYPGSGVCGSKLCRIKLVTLQETIKLGTVPPSQAGRLADVPMGDFQEPHEVLLLEMVLGVI